MSDIDPKAWAGHTPGPWQLDENGAVEAVNNGEVICCLAERDAALIADAWRLPSLAAEVERLARENSLLRASNWQLRDWLKQILDVKIEAAEPNDSDIPEHLTDYIRALQVVVSETESLAGNALDEAGHD